MKLIKYPNNEREKYVYTPLKESARGLMYRYTRKFGENS